MYHQKIDDSVFLLRIKRGEKVIDSLKRFCQKIKIRSGFFYGLGALDEVILANYDVENKKYKEKKFGGSYELVNLVGNLAYFQEEIIIHTHASLANEKM